MLTRTVLFSTLDYNDDPSWLMNFPKPVDPDGLVSHFEAAGLPNRDLKQWLIDTYEGEEVEHGNFYVGDIQSADEERRSEEYREEYRKELAAHVCDDNCLRHLSTGLSSETINQSQP